MSEVVIAAGGLPFGPNTIEHYSLGGSETAALQMAKEMRALDHLVTIFCNLPLPPREDAIVSGMIDEDGIRWVSLEAFAPFIANTDTDLLIISRDPRMFGIPHRAKKAVLWAHDLALYNSQQTLMNVAWNFDEVWTVSEYHRQQFHKVTGYPLGNIRATRNGIVRFDDLEPGIRVPKQLLYAARPERGLEELVKPGGIMELLPDYHLKVCTYDNFPEQMREYYEMIFGRCNALPNVTMLGSLTQRALRTLMAESDLYVYPTAFEEVSCILARETAEQGLPFVTTRVGALPETLGDLDGYKGAFFSSWKPGDENFTEEFANLIKGLGPRQINPMRNRISARKDLYWADVAKDWTDWSAPVNTTSDFSRMVALEKVGDIMALKALYEHQRALKGTGNFNPEMADLYQGVSRRYKDVIEGEPGDIADAYESRYLRNVERGGGKFSDLTGESRFEQLCQELERVDGSDILDYGCSDGNYMINLAKRFPDKNFTGVDHNEAAFIYGRKMVEEAGVTNVEFVLDFAHEPPRGGYDAVMACEVLEHVTEPWGFMQMVEAFCKVGGRCITTVPSGAWEWIHITSNPIAYQQDPEHIWHIDKWMLRLMFADKIDSTMASISSGNTKFGPIGHLVYSYSADHKPIHPIDAYEKSQNAPCRQSICASIIAHDSAEMILKTLNSIKDIADQIIVAVSTVTTDDTRKIIETWAYANPWLHVIIKDVPKVEVNKFGFDDARNRSIEGVVADWVLWIDTDEYLSHAENLPKFLRSNAFDSYAIFQHHFTCDPRGTPAQLDRPARLFRNNGKFQFYGKVHEHAEIGYNEGPGFTLVLPDVDIGHVGYVNERVRRDRFGRNFPLLEWDRNVNPDRKLGKFLWLRDMFHRLQFLAESGDNAGARRMAEETVSFYNECVDDIKSVGASGASATDYYSAAMKILGRGVPVEIALKVGENTLVVNGQFDDAESALLQVQETLKEEMKRKSSGYMM